MNIILPQIILSVTFMSVYSESMIPAVKKGTIIMAKKKAGSYAIPYLITIFLGLLIVGGAAYFIYNYLGYGKPKELTTPTPRNVQITTYDDNHTILFVLEEPDTKSPYSFMLMRSIPKDKKLLFIGIPTNTIAVVDGQQRSIQGAYETGGMTSALAFTEQVFGVTVDRYMKLQSDSLIKICDIFGGVTYAVPSDTVGFNSDGSEQYLNAEQIEKLVTYPMYADGEVQRAYTMSSITAHMINQTDGMRISDNFDNSFSAIINMTDSNITAVDYREHKVAIKNMFERGSSIASFLVMDGTDSYGDFIPSQSFINNVVDTYFNQESK